MTDDPNLFEAHGVKMSSAEKDELKQLVRDCLAALRPGKRPAGTVLNVVQSLVATVALSYTMDEEATLGVLDQLMAAAKEGVQHHYAQKAKQVGQANQWKRGKMQ